MSRLALYQMHDQMLDYRETAIHFPITQLINELHVKEEKWEQIMSQSDGFTCSDELVLKVYLHTLVFTHLKTAYFSYKASMLTTFSVL